MGIIGNLVSIGVGLTAEAVNSKKNRQGSLQQQMQGPRQTTRQPAYHKDYDEDGYDSDSLPPPYSSAVIPRQTPQPAARLPYPVIIPQRRPESSSRGWMLAYAPDLGSFGIDQATFLKFIYDFNESYKTSPYLDAINLAAFGVGFIPGITPIVVSAGVTLAVSYAKKQQSKRHAWTYIDRMNSELFEPRGLFAVVMTLQPTNQASLSVDSETSEIVGSSGTLDYDATTTITPELPQSAPLIFPSREEIAALRPRGNKLVEMGHFTADYLDRRAQAKYAQKNPNSGLAVRNIQFNSSLSDPRYYNAGNSGGRSRPLTSGRSSERNLRRETRREERREERGERHHLRDNIKPKASDSILYLMIAEKPSDEDMDRLNHPTAMPFAVSQPQPLPDPRANGVYIPYRPAPAPVPQQRQMGYPVGNSVYESRYIDANANRWR